MKGGLMKVWSKGLGSIELKLDFSSYSVRKDGNQTYIEGLITDPVYWDFRITMTKEDIKGLLHVATQWHMILFFLSNMSEMMKFFFQSIIKRLYYLTNPFKKIASIIKSNALTTYHAHGRGYGSTS